MIIVVAVQSRPVVSDSLCSHGLQHTRLPGSSQSLRVGLSLCPLSWWCHPIISSSVAPLLLLPSVFPSIRDFSSESALGIRWPQYWTSSFSISPFNKYSELISLKIDWFDLLAVQGTLKVFASTTVEGISSLLLCLLYSPALTTICDQWENQSLDKTDFPQQSNVSAF